MKKIDKLLFKSYIGPMVLTFFIVMFVLVMQFLWRYIEDLVGKGLDGGVIMELMLWAAATIMHMGLPLATLLAALMIMGDFGENYELLAMKSAGMSLPRIMRPLIFVVGGVSIGSFFIANHLQPYATSKLYSILYDISRQKQVIEFKDGLFFNGIDNMSIRVGHQDPETKLLNDIIIYDTRSLNGNMNTTVADSGYIRLSDDKKYLLVTLYNGENYEQRRTSREWFNQSLLRRQSFTEQNGVIPLSGFDFERTEQDYRNSQTKNIAELTHGIDSLNRLVYLANARSYERLLIDYIFPLDRRLAQDTMEVNNKHKSKVILADSIAKLDLRASKSLWENAKTTANVSRSTMTYDEQSSKDALNHLYRHKVEWHRKLSLPISILIFFMVGAPLGAIIRKGGLGMPIVVSILFFVIYYIISLTGEKLAKEGSWSTFAGMWISTFILLPLSVFLTYKASKDSNLFNADWYYIKYRKAKEWLMRRAERRENRKKTG